MSVKNQKKIKEILKWSYKQSVSAHDIFDQLNDIDKAIKCFYSDECPKDQTGMVISVEDAQLLAYEYARQLLQSKNIK